MAKTSEKQHVFEILRVRENCADSLTTVLDESRHKASLKISSFFAFYLPFDFNLGFVSVS